MWKLCLMFCELSDCFPKRLHHFTFSPTMYGGYSFSTSLSTLVSVWLFDSSHPCGCVVSHGGYDVHFHNDWWCWASFHVLNGHLYVFLKEMLRFFPHFYFFFSLLYFCFENLLINLFIWLCWVLVAASRISVAVCGIEPGPPALGAWRLSHWTTRKVPLSPILNWAVFLLLSSKCSLYMLDMSLIRRAEAGFLCFYTPPSSPACSRCFMKIWGPIEGGKDGLRV